MIKLYSLFWSLLVTICCCSCGRQDHDVNGIKKYALQVPNSYILGLWDQEGGRAGNLFWDPFMGDKTQIKIDPIGTVKVSPYPSKVSAHTYLNKPASGQFNNVSLFRVDLSEGLTSADLLIHLDQRLVALWEPNRINHLFVSKQVPISKSVIPRRSHKLLTSDNFFADLYDRYKKNGGYWWLDAIGVDRVYEALSRRDMEKYPDSMLGDAAPVIAILDSGIDYLHPALSKKVWVNPKPGLSGCERDEYGCDTTVSTGLPLGKGPAIPFATEAAGESCPVETSQGKTFLNGACIHGSHVAGLIVANDEYGVPGICPHCKVLSIKVVENIDGEGKVPDSAILKGLKYVQNINELHGGIVKVVNSSFGKFEQSLSVTLLVRELMESGVIVVGASGNENTNERVFPAALEEVIAVTAISREGKKSSYSNFGSWISLAAPGGDVERGSRSDEAIGSTVPGGGVYLSQGTSVATPLVAGVAGLIQMLETDLQSRQLKERLIWSANRKLYDTNFADGYNKPYGPKYGTEYIPGLLGQGILDGFAAYLGNADGEEKLVNSLRVPPGCGCIKGKSHIAKLPNLILIMMYLMPIILLGLRRKGGA